MASCFWFHGTTEEERKRTEENISKVLKQNSGEESVNSLTFKDIQVLKRLLDNQAETIEDLIRERDEVIEDRFALRKKHEACIRKIEKLEAKENETCQWEERTTGIRAILKNTRTPIANKVLFALSNPKYENISDTFSEEETSAAKTLLFTICGGPDTAIGSMKLRRGGRRTSKQEKDIEDITTAIKILDSDGMTPLLIITNEELLELDQKLTKSHTTEEKNQQSTNEDHLSHQVLGPDIPVQHPVNTSELVDTLTERIKEKLDKIVEKKLEDLSGVHKADYAQNIKEVIQQDRNEQNLQEREKKLRSPNVIIHGLKEGINDGDVIKELFETVNVVHSPISITRLGTQTINTARPIKLVMKTKKEKQVFMSAFPKLKTGKYEFKRISVTPDYTKEERREIATWVARAKVKTAEENEGSIWKARGSPGNMRLVKYQTRRMMTTTVRKSAL